MIDTQVTRLHKPLFILLALCSMFLIGYSLDAHAQRLEDQIRERLKPAGELCLMGEDCAAGLVAAAGGGADMAPDEIYQTYCFACHGTGANNSPTLDDAEAWVSRIDQGIDVLYDHAINGFNNNAMPAMGLCMTCTEDQVRETVDYMLEEIE